jgi:hypothetical protein
MDDIKRREFIGYESVKRLRSMELVRSNGVFALKKKAVGACRGM